MTEKEGIILLRVSTTSQDYEAQKIDLEKFALLKGYTKTHIVEAKESGLADFKQREGLKKLFELIESNPKIDAVFATEMSRVSRKQSILHKIKDYFVSHRIQFYLRDGGFCLLDEVTREPKDDGILFTLYGYFAENEADAKKKRFSRAKKALLENGFFIGGKILFGFDLFKEEKSRSRLIVNEEHANQIRKIFDWYLNGISIDIPNPSIKRISKECILQGFHRYTHSKRNVNKLLKEEGYLGEKVTHNKRKNPEAKHKTGINAYVITENTIRYPIQIIPKDIFDKVQAKLKSNINDAEKTQHPTILAKLIQCPKCGNHLSANYRTTQGFIRHTYRCTGRSKTIGCNSTKSLSMSLLDSAVWSVIKSDYELLKKTIAENNPNERMAELDRNLVTVQNKIDEVEKEREEVEYNMIRARKTQKNLYEKLLHDDIQLEKDLKYWNSKHKEIQLEKEAVVNSQEDAIILLQNTIEKIEGSQELVKQFVNLFVSGIHILLHNQRFTIIKVNFKKISDTREVRIKYGNKTIISDGEIEPSVSVVLDKRLTLNVKAIKSTGNNFTVKNGVVFFRDLNDSKELDFQETFRLMEKYGQFVVLDAKILEFKKLNVYQTTKKLKVNQIDAQTKQ